MHPGVRRAVHVLQLLLALVTISAVVGVLAAGVAMPAVGATGSSVKSAVDIFNSLPDELSQPPLNQQSKILDADGQIIATPYSENRIIKPLSKISPWMQKAQLAIEDSRFYEHGGLDPRGLMRALASTASGDTQGASTLTQQYVKMTLQANALDAGDLNAAKEAVTQDGVAGLSRKLQELRYAIRLEQVLTKDQILEGYLNLAYYGDQAYGVEAASEHYFSIPASKLNYAQSALLAGIVQRPGDYDPVNNPKQAQARRNTVLDRMATLKIITNKQATAAKKVPVAKMLKVSTPKSTCQRSTQPYFCNYVMAWLKEQPALGKTPTERLKKINTGGLTIQTTLDPKLTAKANDVLKKRVYPSEAKRVGAAASVIEPGTGKVLAIAQSSNFSATKKNKVATQVNWNVDTKYGSAGGQHFGSTGKAFVLAAALDKGTAVNSTINAPMAGPGRPATVNGSDDADGCTGGGTFKVFNAGYEGGNMTLDQATAQSVNSAFIALAMHTGICTVQKMETRLGLHQANGTEIPTLPNAVTLGNADVAPLTLAASYAAFAADGKYCTPLPVSSVKDASGKAIKVQGPDCKQAISPAVAAGVTKLLEGVLTHGTARGKGLPGRESAGKTGTESDAAETWFVGYTPQLVTAVWVGTPLSNKSLQGQVIGGRVNYDAQGASIPAPIWHDIMVYAHEGKPVEQFSNPTDKVLYGDLIPVPGVAGMSPSAAVATLNAAGFQGYIAGQTDSTISAGAAAGTTASGRVARGSSVGVLISTGKAPKPKETETEKPDDKPTKTKPSDKPTKTKPTRPRSTNPPRR